MNQRVTNKINSIAIDGPAASGKSTLGLKLAEHFGFVFFDTGVMYRAVTLAALESGVPIDDKAACTQLAEQVSIDIAPPSKEDGRPNDVLVDGADRTWQIRQPDVEANVSQVAAYPGVRKALTAQQRRIGMRGGVVLVGRDTGTVVLPEAVLKIYLDASVEERAKRRFQEAANRDEKITFQGVLDSMRARDEIDSHRDVAPLCAAEDALIIDSDEKNAQEIFNIVRQIAETRLGK